MVVERIVAWEDIKRAICGGSSRTRGKSIKLEIFTDRSEGLGLTGLFG
jgi:hypothetical protein